MKNSYGTFATMIGTSIVAMFIMSYFNNWSIDHVFWSETRAYMVLYMGAVMAVIMLGFMQRMYTSKVLNVAIVSVAIVIFTLSLWLVRSQQTIGDIAWMKAMIPHHSIAILTSRRAQISDPRVRELADRIIQAQMKEIAEMKTLIDELQSSAIAADNGDEQ